MPQRTSAELPRPASTALRERDTLRRRHNETVRRLAALPAPPGPSLYDSETEIGYLLLDQIAYLRSAVDAIAPLFERSADDAADYGGAHSESFDIVRAATEDFIAPITCAAEKLTDGS